jgi:hypothetical protein
MNIEASLDSYKEVAWGERSYGSYYHQQMDNARRHEEPASEV